MKIILFVLICVICCDVDAYRILGVFPVASQSHFYVGNALMEGLAEKGHDVTVLSPFDSNNSYKNYKHIPLELTRQLYKESMYQIVAFT